MVDLDRMKKAPIFRGFSDAAIETALAMGTEQTFSAAQTIFREGEPGQYLFIVLDGVVSIHCGDKFMARCRQYDAFGEMASLQQRSRSATARAMTEVRVLAYGEEAVARLLESPLAVRFLLNVIAILSKRLESGNAWIANSLEAQRQDGNVDQR